MCQDGIGRENTTGERIAEEEKVRERVDAEGKRWKKAYVGGGAHFRNWLDQFIELRGKANIEVEEIDPGGFPCFEESGEKMYQIWLKESHLEQNKELP